MYRSPTRRWVDPKCTVLDMPDGIIGPFVELADGGLLTVKDGGVRRSYDDGNTWSAPEPIYDGPGPGVPSSGLLLRTRDGVIVLVFVDNSNFYWFWDDSTRRPAENVRSNVWTVRSTDEGRTWTDRQMIMEGFNGALITMIETRCGKIVEFECDEIEAAQERIAAKFDFRVLRHRHELYGHCSDCRRED